MQRSSRTIGAMVRAWTAATLTAVSVISLSPVALAGSNGTDRPIAGTCDTVVTPLNPGSNLAYLHIDLTCHLRHLGLTTGTALQVVNPAGPPVGPVLPIVISTDITYIAANGDMLHSKFVGAGTINFATGTAMFEGEETYHGGTGRFEHATGSSFAEGDASLSDNTGFITIIGVISY